MFSHGHTRRNVKCCSVPENCKTLPRSKNHHFIVQFDTKLPLKEESLSPSVVAFMRSLSLPYVPNPSFMICATNGSPISTSSVRARPQGERRRARAGPITGSALDCKTDSKRTLDVSRVNNALLPGRVCICVFSLVELGSSYSSFFS